MVSASHTRAKDQNLQVRVRTVMAWHHRSQRQRILNELEEASEKVGQADDDEDACCGKEIWVGV